ncbi:MAG: class I SAM-dependent methyltransferase [Polaribacter sp.]|nr:class I SAM-dependent methyltransferase [Polaribacter sp.]
MNKKERLYKGLSPVMHCKDHTVSQETFEILKNEAYQLLVTSPVPLELEKYYKSEDYISHTNSKKGLLDNIYQNVRKYTVRKKRQLIDSFQTTEKNLLDVGAGTGDFLNTCKTNGWNVSGIEPNKDARKNALKKGIRLEVDLFSLQPNSFDVITLWHVLEHVARLDEYIEQLKKVLKPDGVLFIAVPNYKSFDAAYYKEHWAAFDVPRHLWHFSQFSIQKLFNEVEMKVVKTKPMKFDSYYVSLLSEKHKSGFMNPFKAFYIGFRSNLKARRTSEYSSLIYVIKNK